MSGSGLHIGLMSGTSIDGLDAVLADFDADPPRVLSHVHLAFDDSLRGELTSLQRAGADELDRAALAANALMDVCAVAVDEALRAAAVARTQVAALGVHGQTVRHRPERGYTLQLANPARLAERTGITVVADFRSRDVAAGGQGAPLVPAFHAALFALPDRHRVIVNLGGIANITDLPREGIGERVVRGFDTGPGNTLIDAWSERHTGERFDRDGAWAAGGSIIAPLLDALASDDYFQRAPPKSTGRDQFDLPWVERTMRGVHPARDVARTLTRLTALTVARAIAAHCAEASEVVLCGGGARNATLVSDIAEGVAPRRVVLSSALGMPVDQVEAMAFAWLAREALAGRPGNLPAVTGARGRRILGAIYPA